MITGFASLVAEFNDYVQIANNKYALDIRQCRHPIIERISEESFVSNDVRFSIMNFNFFFRPNGAGKSTFIRQVALIQILAQSGCYVPCKKAKLKICDRLFTRIGVRFHYEFQNN
eukprot:GSMAST32.ASY1.ANO1.116.1 assembled CDS